MTESQQHEPATCANEETCQECEGWRNGYVAGKSKALHEVRHDYGGDAMAARKDVMKGGAIALIHYAVFSILNFQGDGTKEFEELCADATVNLVKTPHVAQAIEAGAYETAMKRAIGMAMIHNIRVRAAVEEIAEREMQNEI